MRFLLLTALVILTACGPRGAIRSACLDAGRKAANPALCACVQGAANGTLSRGEQKRAAKFFADPERAQDTRRRDDRASEAFWARYKRFSDRAARQCG